MHGFLVCMCLSHLCNCVVALKTHVVAVVIPIILVQYTSREASRQRNSIPIDSFFEWRLPSV